MGCLLKGRRAELELRQLAKASVHGPQVSLPRRNTAGEPLEDLQPHRPWPLQASENEE